MDKGDEDIRLKFLFRQVCLYFCGWFTVWALLYFSQVFQAFRHISLDKLIEFWNGESVQRTISDFLDNPETQVIFFKEGKGTLEISDVAVQNGKGQLFYFVKINKTQVSEVRIAQELVHLPVVVCVGDVRHTEFKKEERFR